MCIQNVAEQPGISPSASSNNLAAHPALPTAPTLSHPTPAVYQIHAHKNKKIDRYQRTLIVVVMTGTHARLCAAVDNDHTVKFVTLRANVATHTSIYAIGPPYLLRMNISGMLAQRLGKHQNAPFCPTKTKRNETKQETRSRISFLFQLLEIYRTTAVAAWLV